jgi:hypothetical protein
MVAILALNGRGADYDELSELESSSRRHGYEVVKPPTLKGRSGVLHGFSLLVSNGRRLFRGRMRDLDR